MPLASGQHLALSWDFSVPALMRACEPSSVHTLAKLTQSNFGKSRYLTEFDMTILIRADAGPSIGLGHVARSTSLGVALANQGARVELIGRNSRDTIDGFGAPFASSDLPKAVTAGDENDAALIVQRDPALVIVDGYHFSRQFFATLSFGGIPYVVIDDNGETQGPNPVMILNQNSHATESLYRYFDDTPRLLIGLEYCLIRAEARALLRSPINQNGQIFVAFGGSDSSGLTGKVVEGLLSLGREMKVALGSQVPQRHSVARNVQSFNGVEVVKNGEYLKDLSRSSLAVLAAGSSLWEAACLGVPVLAQVVADNQLGLARAAAELGFVRLVEGRGSPRQIASLAMELISDEDQLRSMSLLGRRYVDGLGAERAASQIREYCLV